MKIGIVGCGYVADFYMKTLGNHSELELVAVYDRDGARARRFCELHKQRSVGTLAELLGNPRIDMIVNLTNPSSHFEVSRAALEAGKHVYSEKPLALSLDDAEELVRIAEARKLRLAGAPCSVLGESAQTLWKQLREKAIGTPRLVYAEIDDGPVHLMDFQSWKSDSGAPWPAKDEFEVGCTLEHAGYYVTWLVAFFGPAVRLTSFASLLVPDKGIALDIATNDFSVACLEFASGLVARITCSIYGPHDHALRIIGDEGVLSIDDCWDYGSTVRLSRRTKLGLRAEKHPRAARLAGLGPRKVPLVRKPDFAFKTKGANRMDFMRGVAEVTDAVRESRPCRMSARFALHVNEIVLAIQNPSVLGSPRKLRTTFDAMAPMPWAT